MTSAGRRMVDAIVARDLDGFRATLADDVDFKGLTPGRLWEATDPAGVQDVVLGTWFAEEDRVEALTHLEESEVADTQRVAYRFDLETPGGSHVAEQQAYYRTTDDGERIAYLRVMCSGFRKV